MMQPRNIEKWLIRSEASRQAQEKETRGFSENERSSFLGERGGGSGGSTCLSVDMNKGACC